LEQEIFTNHPLLYKKRLIKEDYGVAYRKESYRYSKRLQEIEPLILTDLPTLKKDSPELIVEFVIIPIFFRDHPFGCVAFFNPKAKGRDAWFEYLSKVYTLLDERKILYIRLQSKIFVRKYQRFSSIIAGARKKL